jgi:transposase
LCPVRLVRLGERAGPDAVNAGLRAANAQLRLLLQSQVADLAARLQQDSKNFSRPPSSDGLEKPAPTSLRRPAAGWAGRRDSPG